jgi:hypothetical protein
LIIESVVLQADMRISTSKESKKDKIFSKLEIRKEIGLEP